MGGPTHERKKLELIPWQADAGVDIVSALISATCAAPIILTIDKAVVEAMAGTWGKSSSPFSLAKALGAGFFSLLRRPHMLFGQIGFYMTVGVYGSTYMTANLTDTVCERRLDPDDPKSAFIQGTAKLLCTTAVNMGTGVAKDAAFARMFGANSASPTPTPPLTYGLFAFRDLLTIAGGFTVPPLLSAALVQSGTLDEAKAPAAAQVLSPCGMQIACTPLHLLALNYYNMPTATPMERLKDVGGIFPQATFSRMFRFCAAYGMGGLTNKYLLAKGRDYVEQKYCGSPVGAGRGATATSDAAVPTLMVPPKK
jgi:hypothetical protein